MSISHVTLTASDLDRSVAFYTELLDFRLRARWVRGAYLERGATWLCLELSAVRIADDDSHIAFAIARETFALRAAAVRDRASIWKENQSEGDSVYFVDPDGHKLELHVGDLESRLASCRVKPYDGMQFFE